MRVVSLIVALGALALGASASAQVTPVDLSAFSGNEAVLDFEGQAESAQVMGQFSGLGVVFDSEAGVWQVDAHSGYGAPFATAAAAAGAGAVGLLHADLGEEILFTEPVIRVGFQFGSNRDIDVPVTFFRGGAQIGSANLVVQTDQLPFFGFEDPDGIDKVVFADELNGPSFVSQLDNLRFETEATASGKGAKAGKALLTPPVATGATGSFSCRVTNGGSGPSALRLAILDAEGDPLAVEDRTVAPDAFGSVTTAASSAGAASCKVSLLGKGNTKALRSSLTASDAVGTVLTTVEGR